MILRLPLLGRILAWLLLNLLILAAAFGVFVWTELGAESLLGRIAGERSQAAAGGLLSELRERPIPEWERALARFEEAYPVRVLLIREDGSRFLGAQLDVPAEVLSRLRDLGTGPGMEDRRPGPPPGMMPEDRFDAGPPGNPGPPPPRFGPRSPMGGPRVFLRAGRPSRYWLVQVGPIRGPGIPRGVRLAMVSESLSAGGLFFDVRSWLWAATAVIAVSVLWWLPFVRGITRSVSRISEATSLIAEGRFDARVPEDRGDELGRLGASINRMSGRLEGLVHGQKRFLGDVAHELCSPLARMEMALGVLEQRAEAEVRPYVEDVREEVRHMSALVDELLQFSKAALKSPDADRVPVSLAELTRRVVSRELPEPGDLSVQVPEGLEVLGHRDLVERAMGNLLRNARHHAGTHGPIRIEAFAEGPHRVLWRVVDSGPGVPESELRRLGEPFYRPDLSRSSDTGGTGLGLAIVKTCMAACRGSLELANGPQRGPGGGLVATLVFEPASRTETPSAPEHE
jgi:two-component system sensor histidine kinase CpxA